MATEQGSTRLLGMKPTMELIASRYWLHCIYSQSNRVLYVKLSPDGTNLEQSTAIWISDATFDSYGFEAAFVGVTQKIISASGTDVNAF